MLVILYNPIIYIKYYVYTPKFDLLFFVKSEDGDLLTMVKSLQCHHVTKRALKLINLATSDSSRLQCQDLGSGSIQYSTIEQH